MRGICACVTAFVEMAWGQKPRQKRDGAGPFPMRRQHNLWVVACRCRLLHYI